MFKVLPVSIPPQDEVYVQLDKLRDSKIIQHTFNAPCGKGQGGSYFSVNTVSVRHHYFGKLA